MNTRNVTDPNQPQIVFQPDEVKQVSIGFQEKDGKIELVVTSVGANDDINEIATLLSFALEKLLEADPQ